MGRKQNPLSARVKRMMQADVEVGKIAGPTPVLISAIPVLRVSLLPTVGLLLCVWQVSRRSREVLLLAQFTGSNSPQHACR